MAEQGKKSFLKRMEDIQDGAWGELERAKTGIDPMQVHKNQMKRVLGGKLDTGVTTKGIPGMKGYFDTASRLKRTLSPLEAQREKRKERRTLAEDLKDYFRGDRAQSFMDDPDKAISTLFAKPKEGFESMGDTFRAEGKYLGVTAEQMGNYLKREYAKKKTQDSFASSQQKRRDAITEQKRLTRERNADVSSRFGKTQRDVKGADGKVVKNEDGSTKKEWVTPSYEEQIKGQTERYNKRLADQDAAKVTAIKARKAREEMRKRQRNKEKGDTPTKAPTGKDTPEKTTA